MLVVALVVLLARLLHAAQLLQQVGRHPVRRRCRPQCRAVVHRRGASVPRLLETVAFHHQRTDIARIERQHAVGGGAHPSPILQRAARVREPQHDGDIGLPGLGGLQEKITGGAGITAAESICGSARASAGPSLRGAFMVCKG
ncbi:MAG: hypothetical protein IPF84_03515 [Proteobacteria bacterium]|nr:hypothetical protein [Pseudomonadota bacterium]